MKKKINIKLLLRGREPRDPVYFSSPSNPNQCDGCGVTFDYEIHEHIGFRSCSIACDKIIEEYLDSEPLGGNKMDYLK